MISTWCACLCLFDVWADYVSHQNVSKCTRTENLRTHPFVPRPGQGCLTSRTWMRLGGTPNGGPGKELAHLLSFETVRTQNAFTTTPPTPTNKDQGLPRTSPPPIPYHLRRQINARSRKSERILRLSPSPILSPIKRRRLVVNLKVNCKSFSSIIWSSKLKFVTPWMQ